MTDFSIHNHGSLFTFVPLNDNAQDWMARTAPEDAQFFGGGLVVEPRFVQGVINAIEADGMTVQS